MIEDINERMTQFAPSQNNPLNDDPIADKIVMARQVTQQPNAATIDVDPIADRIVQNRRDLMMATFGSAAEANPDQAAQAKKLGEQFGVGADIAGRNMQQLKKQALLDELERRDLMRRDPILARYLSNHDFAAMAHDDIDNLAKTEDLFQGSWFARYEDPIAYGKKTISMIDERFRRGRAIVEMGRANDLLGLRAQWSPDPRKASEISEELKKLTTDGGIVGAGVEVVGQMLEGIPEVAETTAMGATAGGAVGAVGGPAGFLTIPAGMLTGAGAGFAAGSARSAFMAESGNSYQQMIEQGYDPEVARKAAIGVGVVNASIEMISFGALGPVLRKLGVNVFRTAVANALAKPTAAKALATLGGDYAKAVAAGASEEFLQEIATGIGDDIARVYGSSSPSRILDEGGITDLLGTALESGVQGAMGMAILGGIGPVANFRYDMRRAGAAERQQAFFERLSANAVDSKLRGRDMNAFERFVASQAEGTEAETIFVDAAAMQGVLRQSNLSDEQIDEALPGVREQLQAAAQTGGDVTLPTAAFAARVAGTDLGNAMLPHVRLAPDAMSVTEAQEFQKNRDQLVEQARVIMEEKGRADDTFVQEAQAIEDRIYQEVVATGTMDEKAARANATFVRDLYVTMAARMNTTPAALEQRFPYRVEAQGIAITEPLEQASRLMYPSLAKAWDRYNSGERYMTIGDLADKIESLDLEGKRIPQSVLDAVQNFRNAQREEREIYGERGGTEDDAGNALEIAVQNAAEQVREEQIPPTIMEQAATMDAAVSQLAMTAQRGRRTTSGDVVITPEEEQILENFIDIEIERQIEKERKKFAKEEANASKTPEELDKALQAHDTKLRKQLKKKFMATAAEDKAAVRETLIRHKSAHPVEQGWAFLELGRVVWIDKGDGKGKWENQYKIIPYAFERDEDGNTLVPQTKEYDDRVNALASRMTDEVLAVHMRAMAGDDNAAKIIRQARWYYAMRTRLRQEFGGLGDLFADLLGATSPNTPVRDNWYNAVDALRRAMRGDWDEMLPKWIEWVEKIEELELAMRAYLDNGIALGRSVADIQRDSKYEKMAEDLKEARKFPDALYPRKENEAKYGFNGKNIVRAMVDLWRTIRDEDVQIGRGATAPKALNFSGNLIGFRQRATIDVWAARELQRLAGLARIPSMAEAGVAGAMLSTGATTGQFGFGQDVFAEAVKKIRSHPVLSKVPELAKINDDDLQALVWFVEKELWTINDWTSTAGEGGSFELEASLTGTNRQEWVKGLRRILDAAPPRALIDTAAKKPAAAAARKAWEPQREILAKKLEELEATRKRAMEAKRSQKKADPADLRTKEQIEQIDADIKATKESLKATRPLDTALNQATTAEVRLEMFNLRKRKAAVLLTKLERTVDRFTGGLSEQQSLDTQGVEYIPTDADMAMLSEALRTAIYETDNGATVLASKVLATEGRYGSIERSMDIEAVVRQGYDIRPLWLTMLKRAKAANQDSTFLSRILRVGEIVDPLYHRPGVEIYFRTSIEPSKLQQIIDKLRAKNVDMFTVIVDGRRLPGTMAGEMGNAVGVRFQYIPEFDQRYGEDLANLSDDQLRAKVSQKAEEMRDIVAAVLADVSEVSSALQLWHETRVAFASQYDEEIRNAGTVAVGAVEGGGSQTRAEVWRGQSVRDGIERADRHAREAAKRKPDGADGQAVAGIQQPGILEQSPVTTGFYSALEREVAAIDAKALTASAWAERFKGLLAKGAIKADELEWSGLNDYLKMQEGKVSKDAVLEFLRGNGVRVERTTLMQRETGADPADIRTLNDAGLVISQDPYNFDDPTFFDNKSESFLDAADVQSLANQGKVSQDVADAALRVASLVQPSGSPKYNRQPLVLHGGTNYREVLLTLPVKPSPELSGTIEALPNGKFRVDYPGTRSFVFDTREEAESDLGEMRLAMGEKPSGVFRSTHWDQPNVLVHLRMNDRVDADGKRVLFVEEVQSDWGQQGRKQRFAGGFIRAPFVDNTDGWLNLGLKQVLLEAVRGNYDRVAFVNGEQSAQRYDLSQQVDVVNVSRGGGTTWEIWADKDGQMVVREDVKTIEEVEEVLGKELAAKVADMKPGESARTFSGVDLKVGGEGMKAFYDKIVPIAMGKLLKKYVGVKLGSVMLPNMRQQEMEADAERMGMTIEDVLDVAEESEYAQAQLGFDITPEMIKKLESGLPLFQAAAGPARGGFDPSRLTTILNKNADLSTFIHETAHFYLTILGNLAADPAATPEIRADMDTLLKWFGIAGDTDAARLAAWNALSVDQQRKYHEQFAYSFEIYMFEGKSPSAEMQGLFDRFSAWLKRVYRSIRDDLNAIYRREFGEDLPLLTGEVRQVMDRMLASEEQIKRQAAINEMKPWFQTQEQSGMDDAEWAAYQQMQQEAIEAAVTDMNKASLRQMQWLSNARARILRDLQAKHAKQRKEIREEVADEIRRRPLYRAMEYLRTGTFTDADGEAVKMEGAHRLDMESVRQMYELEPENLRPDIAKLGTGGRGMMGMNGIDPDVAAELFGFSSGDELIRALIEAQPMKEAIDARTDELMLERFSELSTPEGREAKVQESLHNEARARLVAVELRFVAKATQPARVLVEAARQAAREMIAAKRIADLRPSEFIAAEARAARAAGKIGKQVNVDAVAQAAYTRAKNEALASGAPEDIAEAGAVVARDAARAAAQARLDEQRAQYGADSAQALIRAKRAQLYQNQLAAEALAARDEVENGVRYLRQVMRDSNVKRMGADVADQIDRILERFNLRPMSAKRMAERQSLVQWLESLKESGLEPDLAPEILDEAARKPYREMTVAEFRDLVDAVKQLEYIGKNAQKIKRAQEMAEFEEVRDEIVASVRGNFTGKETKPRTPTTSMGKRIAKAKRFLYSHLKAAAIARIMDGGQDDGPVWNFLIRTANEAGDMETRMRAEATKRLTEILAPVFALGKMGGKGIYFDTVGMSLNREARLVIALNMGNDGNRQRLLDGEGWTLEQVQPILESLTEAEWKAVQDVWDYMESFRPLVGAKERRLYGREPKWVTPVPFTVRTADGKEVRLSGGYYPIKYDPIATERAETADEAEKARTELRGAYTAATTRRSFTKARAAKVEDRPLLYTMTGVYSGINDVIHDLAWHEWLIQANRLMRDEKFDRAVRETYGAEFKSQLKGWIKDVAAGERGAEDAADMFASYIRRSVSAAGLGFNIVSAILQVTGFSQSIVRVGAKHIARGVAATTASPLQTMKFVNEKSSFMQERARTQFRELNELRNMVGDESAAQRRLRLGTYFLMMRMQRMVDVPTWVGAYEKALEAGKDDATAVALADQAVIDSQGSGMLKDLSKIERGGALSTLFTVFYSYMNTVYNMAAVSTMTPRSKGRLAADYAMLFIVPVVLNYALKKALTPDVDDEEPDMEKIATDLVAEELAFLMGTMVGVREFQNAANAVVGKETAARGYEGPAGLRAIGEAGRFAVQAKQLEFDRAFRRSAINMLGIGLGLPSAQINRTIDGVEALAEGETENPFAVLTGVQR